MKSAVSILSSRGWNDYFPVQIVHEWEDVISQELSMPLDGESSIEIKNLSDRKKVKIFQKFVRRSFLIRHIDSSNNYLKKKYPGKLFLSFFLYPLPLVNHYIYNKNIIPILLDCFADVIDKVPEYFKKSKFLFVTNVEVLAHLKKTAIANKIAFVPLSISDKYYRDKIPAKTLDVVQTGRQNPILHEWMLQLVNKHPHIEYVYSSVKDKQHNYFSTKRGWLGPIESRNEFMDFLATAKISLVSAPGIDGGEKRTGGFNPVTPRFYESAICYCYMVGRFPDSPDFIQNEVSSVCERPSDYHDFETMIVKMLREPFIHRDKYEPFIQSHLTSTIAKTIQEELKKL